MNLEEVLEKTIKQRDLLADHVEMEIVRCCDKTSAWHCNRCIARAEILEKAGR